MTAPTGPGFDEPLPGPGDYLPHGEKERNPEEGPDENAEGEEDEEPASPIAKPKPAARPLSGRRIAKLLAPVALVMAVLFLMNFLFDPFGLQVEPIQPLAGAKLANAGNRSEQNEAPAALSGIDLYVLLDEMSLEEYLQSLRNQKIYPSQNPDGIFIGAAFVPLGKAVNPAFGLSLQGIEKSEAILVDEYLREYRIPLL